MRTWFWTLILSAIAVALAVILQTHTGNVIVMMPPHKIEVSITFTVLLVVAAFVAMYVGIRLIAWLLAIPSRVNGWRGRRAQARDHELLEKGWVGILEGRFASAEKHFDKLIDQTRVDKRRAVAALSAARAAQELGEFERRDASLAQARESAGDDPGLSEAVATVTADMYLSQNRAADALAVLAPLHDGASRHLHTTRLLLRAHSHLGHHDQVFSLARALGRRHALAKPEAERLVDLSGAARLRAGSQSGDGWRVIWKEIKSNERAYPQIALAAAQAFDAAGEPEEAARVLETAIAQQFLPVLVAEYARCDASQVKRRIDKAETWLAQRPTDPDILRALGLLCLTGQLWGAAERYLSRSLGYRADPQTHALLGLLYDRLNRSGEATRQWRLATAVGMALPTLASDAALPPADIGSDRYYNAAEVAALDDDNDWDNDAKGVAVASPASDAYDTADYGAGRGATLPAGEAMWADDIAERSPLPSDDADASEISVRSVVQSREDARLSANVLGAGFTGAPAAASEPADQTGRPMTAAEPDRSPDLHAAAGVERSTPDVPVRPPATPDIQRSQASRAALLRSDAPPAHAVVSAEDADDDDYFDSAPPLIDHFDDTGRNDRADSARDDRSNARGQDGRQEPGGSSR